MARRRKAWTVLYQELNALSMATHGSGYERKYLDMAGTVQNLHEGTSAEVSLNLLFRIEELLEKHQIEDLKVQTQIRTAIRRMM